MKSLLYRGASLLAAYFSGMFAAIAVLPLGLILYEIMIWPLVFVVGAIFASLSATWISTLIAPDHTRSPIFRVVGTAIVTALGSALILVLIQLSGLMPLGLPNMVTPGLGMIIIALSASWAAWHFRRPCQGIRGEIGLTLGLAFASAVFLPLLSPIYGVLRYGRTSNLVWIGALLVATSIVLWIWQFRNPHGQLGRDAALTLGLIGLTPLLVVATVYLATRTGLAGA
jgi:hypothetical protein